MKKLITIVCSFLLFATFVYSANNKIKEINDSDFSKVISNKGITIVDFWATWCYPCKVQGNIFENIIDSLPKNVHIYKLDIDANKTIADMYGIKSIPTIIFFQNGKSVKRVVGVKPKNEIFQIINELQ